MTDLTKIYIDLSKLSKRQIKALELLIDSDIGEIQDYPFLFWNGLEWDQCDENNVSKLNLIRLTYPELIKLLDGGDENYGWIKVESEADYYKAMEQEYYKPMETVSESIFSGKITIIPMADVQHIEKYWYPSDEKTRDNYRGINVITKHTRWDIESDFWANNIYLDRQEGDNFLKAWYVYRNELETESLIQKHKQ